MKYICPGYHDPDAFAALSQAQQQAMMDSCFAYDDQLRSNRHFKGGEALQPSNTAMSLRYANERVVVTDGPFSETRGQLGGIIILEARDLNHAVELISHHPSTKHGRWEIRPAADLSEMVRQSEARVMGPNSLAIVCIAALFCLSGVARSQPAVQDRPMGHYASIDGLRIYYETSDAGSPLVVIHGGGSTIDSTHGRILPELSRTRQVIAVELQAHGHTLDIARPLTV